MKTSKTGIELIKRHEGFMAKSYICPAGVLTIGYGHTKTARPGQIITKEIAEELLKLDLVQSENAVTKLVKVPLNQNQFDALVSFVFNLGAGALGASTLLRKLNAKDYSIAQAEFKKWNKAKVRGVLTALPGLTARRNDEAKLFGAANA